MHIDMNIAVYQLHQLQRVSMTEHKRGGNIVSQFDIARYRNFTIAVLRFVENEGVITSYGQYSYNYDSITDGFAVLRESRLHDHNLIAIILW